MKEKQAPKEEDKNNQQDNKINKNLNILPYINVPKLNELLKKVEPKQLNNRQENLKSKPLPKANNNTSNSLSLDKSKQSNELSKNIANNDKPDSKIEDSKENKKNTSMENKQSPSNKNYSLISYFVIGLSAIIALLLSALKLRKNK